MLTRLFLSVLVLSCVSSKAAADSITIQADIVIHDECPDYNAYDSRALVTESKKLHNDIFLYTLGQIPCAVLSTLSAAGALTIVIKTVRGDWHPLCNIGALGLASLCPQFAAWFIDLENKKILARYNCQEIHEVLESYAHAPCFEETK